MAPEAGRERSRGGGEQTGELFGEVGEVVGVKRGDMGQNQGSVAEVFGDGGVAADAADGGEIERRLVLEEFEGGLELAVEED